MGTSIDRIKLPGKHDCKYPRETKTGQALTWNISRRDKLNFSVPVFCAWRFFHLEPWDCVEIEILSYCKRLADWICCFLLFFNGLKFIRTFYVTSWDTVSCFMMLEYQSQRKARKHDIINEILPMKNWDKMNHMFIIKKIDQKIRKRIDRVII